MTTDHNADYVRRAARVMEAATSYFVLEEYAKEGLEALLAEGWTLTPPAHIDGSKTVIPSSSDA